jgi:hypothetical protein
MEYIRNKNKTILFYSNIAIDLNISLNNLAIIIKAIDSDIEDKYNLTINDVHHFTLENNYIEINIKSKFQKEKKEAINCLSV